MAPHATKLRPTAVIKVSSPVYRSQNKLDVCWRAPYGRLMARWRSCRPDLRPLLGWGVGLVSVLLIWVAVTFASAPATAALPANAYAALSRLYVVQPGDTLYRIAEQHGVDWQLLQQINRLDGRIAAGQRLVIPSFAVGGRATAVVPGTACAQLSFAQSQSPPAGIYTLHDVTGGQIAAWVAGAGELYSGWIYQLPISFESVHVRVFYYPSNGGGATQLLVRNPAPDSADGWLARGQCHSLELQFP